MKKTILFIITSLFFLQLTAQNLNGIWVGKISRTAKEYKGEESLELFVEQFGNKISGYSFAYKDTSRFVLFNMYGKRNKKKNEVNITEYGQVFYDLPIDYFPCEKKLYLKYQKIGKTQYLFGKWGGIGLVVDYDTACFPGEELVVVLQKVSKLEKSGNEFFNQKIYGYISRKISGRNKVDTLLNKEALLDKVDVVSIKPADSVPVDRKLDIQQILNTTDSIVTINFYDNAVIDNDTISVFVNKELVLKKRLITSKSLPLQINLKTKGTTTEIIMQAENLGSIPPNTAVAIIETGGKRYEARLSSSYEKSAVIVIVYDD